MTKILILDGGLGTTLEKNHNIHFTQDTPLWSSHLVTSSPSTLLQCQKSFGDIPVDILLTATYQVSIHGFANTKTLADFPNGIPPSEIPRFLETAVQIAESAKQDGADIALSVGPYGACMTPSQEYSGKYDAAHDDVDALFAWHKERMQLFAGIQSLGKRVGYVAVESVPRGDELVAIRRALDAAALGVPHGLPFWMSCLFPNDDGNLPDGSSPEQVINAMLNPDIAKATPWAVGINCTKVWKLDSILRRYEAAISSLLQKGVIQKWPALVLYPDGTNGEVYNTTTKQWEIPDGVAKEGRVPWEDQLAEVVRNTDARGSWPQIVVGGCCMSGPDDIRRLRSTLFKDSIE